MLDTIFSGLGTRVIAAVWPAAGRWLRDRRNSPVASKSLVRVCEAPQGRQYNKEFYNYFAKRLENAKHSIWITGEGFEYKDEEGRAIAEMFVEALRTALRRGVRIVRVQTRSNPHEKWVKALARLHRERKGEDFSCSSCAAIKPHRCRACV